MVANSGEITIESIKAIQQDWEAAEVKTKMQAKVMKRLDFERLPHFQRAAYIKSGGKLVD